jgi:quercetin dioxygenase-like cupin family protein
MQHERQDTAAVSAAPHKTTVVAQTADVRIVEYVLEPGADHPWHHHSEVADNFYCLEGLIGVETRQPPTKLVLRPGEKCRVPPNVVHHASNAGDGTSRYLLVQALGKYDYIRAD